MRFDRTFFEKALPEAEFICSSFPKKGGFSVDTRTLKEGEIFIALKGARVDSHDLIEDALKKGAAGLIMNFSHRQLAIKLKGRHSNKLIILVEDTFKALCKLAKLWRQQFSYPVVGITGSVGKTLTKQILANILKVNGNDAFVSQGNQNTLIGVSLNILKMREEHDVAVFELGISQRGEMAKLADLLRPTIGVITFIGHSHMAGLGSLVDIAAEKREIFRYFSESDIGVVNGDQPLLSQVSYKHPVVKFGSKTLNQLQARKIKVGSAGIEFILKIYGNKHSVVLNTLHQGMVNNILAAGSVARLLRIDDQIILKGINEPALVKGRFEFKYLKNNHGLLIDDCYNASPDSVKMALAAFEEIKTNYSKVIVFSDMRELGTDNAFWHRQIGRFLRKVSSLSYLILVGEMVQETKNTLPVGLNMSMAKDWKEAEILLNEFMKDKKVLVLLKGSTLGYTEGLSKLSASLVDNSVEASVVYNQVFKQPQI